MFLLKKLLGSLLMPLPFSLVLLMLGLMLLWFSSAQSRKQLMGKWLLSLGTAILLASSLPYTSFLLSYTLERDYPPLYAAPIDLEYIVVLGSGHTSDPYLPLQQRLAPAGYYRVMEGLRLMRANPGAMLLLSGYRGSDPVSNARVSSMIAQQEGVPVENIRLFESARDTAEEAALIAAVIKQDKTALVTSASHMRRALALFHAQGVRPLPAPTGFLGKELQNPPYFYQRLPNSDSLNSVTVAWHELVGAVWQTISRTIKGAL
jgi:uncharacterized SAM-binding protein YcdF (DUF218 family)